MCRIFAAVHCSPPVPHSPVHALGAGVDVGHVEVLDVAELNHADGKGGVEDDDRHCEEVMHARFGDEARMEMKSKGA